MTVRGIVTVNPAADNNKEDGEIISQGELYCAKRCGRGCTRAEYEEVVKKANALQERLGSTWNVSIFDNLGWRFKAENGYASLHPPQNRHLSNDDGWLCIINIPNLSGVSANGATPEEAGRNAAKIVISSIKEMLESFSKATDGIADTAEMAFLVDLLKSK